MALTRLLSVMSLAKLGKVKARGSQVQELGTEIRNYLCIVQNTASSLGEPVSELGSGLVTKLEEYIDHVRSGLRGPSYSTDQGSYLGDW